MPVSFVFAIHQTIYNTKTIIFDEKGLEMARGVERLRTVYLDGEYVEQDAYDIYDGAILSVQKCLAAFRENGGSEDQIFSCKITNEPATFVLWDEQGRPLHEAIVSQCQRARGICNMFVLYGWADLIKQKTGLTMELKYSAAKVMWLSQSSSEIRKAIRTGKAFFGTIDTWLLYKFTNGTQFLTERSNASQTMLYNKETRKWDKELISKFDLDGLNLPEIRDTHSHFGFTDFNGLLKKKIEIASMTGVYDNL